jgi:CxxC motif-containing protein (DUF1111 family)
MSPLPQARTRRLVGLAGCIAFVATAGYYIFPGLANLWSNSATAADTDAGATLFLHEWEPNDPLAKGDGLGPVYNDRSCVACHFQGGVGGGGSVEHNVTAFEIRPSRQNPQAMSGMVHAAAVEPNALESISILQQRFPKIRGSAREVQTNGCRSVIVIHEIDPVHSQSVNSTALFGAGLVDRIPGSAISSKYRVALGGRGAGEFDVNLKSVPPGRPRILADGRVGKFGWKAQAASLQEFVAAACANEIGLGNPMMAQATPLACTPTESVPDLDQKQFDSLVTFVDTLPRPEELVPAEAYHRAAAHRGKELFGGIGCAICHTPDVGGVTGVYSDFLLHTLESDNDPSQPNPQYREDPDDQPLTKHLPKLSEWKTPPLWGVADSAPYFHDGASATLRDAVLRHGGDAKVVTEAFQRLSNEDQDALFVFLKTLKAPRNARPVVKSNQLAMRGQ